MSNYTIPETTPERCECGGPAICVRCGRMLPDYSTMALLERIRALENPSKTRRAILDEAFRTLADALDEKADWLEPAFWDASPDTMDELHAALSRFQERGGTE